MLFICKRDPASLEPGENLSTVMREINIAKIQKAAWLISLGTWLQMFTLRTEWWFSQG